MNRIKCECGHVNPEGTVLCEACGKPIEGNQHIDGNDGKNILNMRYDGTARRSLTYRKSFVDKVWGFFSSVKVGVWLIVIALAASALGTIYPQRPHIPANAISRDPAIFYEQTYGVTGKIYYQLGFYDLYGSWWYMILIALIGVSLVICSLDRFVPLYRALKKQKPKRHVTFVSRQRFVSETENVTGEEIQKVKESLHKQRYKISEEDGHILAEKGRFSRWGPYVNHIGLIIILIAALLRQTPWFFLDEYVWVREGEQIVIPGTDGEYYIENKKFILELYDESDEKFRDALQKQGELVPKNFQTNAVIYKKNDDGVIGAESSLDKVIEDQIRMNHPLKFDGYTLYQAGYQLDEFSTMSFKIHKKDDSDAKELASFTVDLTNPEKEYDLENGYRVKMGEFYPEYYLDNGEPRSKSKYVRNPAFVFYIYAPDTSQPEVSFIGIGRNIAADDNEYKLGIINYTTHDVSGLTVRKDYTLPLFGLGALIFMIGVIQGMYWQHRRVWIHPQNGKVIVAAHTNKNWYGLRKDIEKAISQTTIHEVIDRQELDQRNETKGGKS
ncbi:cytochrome c biogenesis protein ResB [Virgibacillus soli]|uniref:Cytochrome c biogenesis protein ResB n=1 Tax=Paracerasibacillus soli TaxID=480284 RepID=A0ABU5CR51_9BACI|nr:cytochrome c biogenesis protein ResB [Virgibacillus soli]MDY0408341.1 cytochrome c biogenesis protein ResB [Virgibacillus soli]